MRAKICNKCGAIIDAKAYSALTTSVYTSAGKEVKCNSDIHLCEKCNNEFEQWISSKPQNHSSSNQTFETTNGGLCIETVEQLKSVLNCLDDKMQLASRSTNLYLKDVITPGIQVKVNKFKVSEQSFTDGFDYTVCQVPVCVEDENGTKYLQIS